MTRYCVFQDLNELELPKTCKTEFPDVDDLLNFKLIIYPDEVTSREKFYQIRYTQDTNKMVLPLTA